MNKKLIINSLAFIFVFSLAGCEKKKDMEPWKNNETTTPHALKDDTTQPDYSNTNNQLHDDINNGVSSPATMENGTSGVETGRSSLSQRKTQQ